ncbi:MAG: hypothetical protein AAF213_05975 [Pseudomonadota bacterium]
MGDSGRDTLQGGRGTDTLRGGEDNDVFIIDDRDANGVINRDLLVDLRLSGANQDDDRWSRLTGDETLTFNIFRQIIGPKARELSENGDELFGSNNAFCGYETINSTDELKAFFNLIQAVAKTNSLVVRPLIACLVGPMPIASMAGQAMMFWPAGGVTID